MFNAIKTAAIAGLVSLTALVAVPARADSIYLGFGNGDARFGVYQGDSSRMHYPDRYRDDYRDDYYRDEYRDQYRHSRCTPERGLRALRLIGLGRIAARSAASRAERSAADLPNA